MHVSKYNKKGEYVKHYNQDSDKKLFGSKEDKANSGGNGQESLFC